MPELEEHKDSKGRTYWRRKGAPPDPELQAIAEAEMDAMENAGLGPEDKVLPAMRKFQEMRASGDFCDIYIMSDYDYVWGIKYVWSEFKYPNGDHKWHTIGHYNSYTLVECVEDCLLYTSEAADE